MAVQALTGITDEMVAKAPTFEEMAAELVARLDGRLLVAHNARFDYGFLRAAFARAGIRYRAPVLCTVKLSRLLFPHQRRHNLDALLIRHALFCADRHRALGDARVLWELARRWRLDPGEAALRSACERLLARPPLPAALPAAIEEDLPEGPGAYVFHGEVGTVLYVGAAADIRSRVLSHFSGTRRTANDAQIAASIRRLEWCETAGELSAHLEKTRLERALQPRFNRNAAGGDRFTWQWSFEKPALPPQLVCVEARDLREGDLFGLFRSRGSAVAALRGLAAAHRLCTVLVGLDDAAPGGGCSAIVDGRCRGACIGGEPVIAHAMRLVQALAALRVRPWPYRGPIAIHEHNRRNARTTVHVIDRWCHLGTARSPDEEYEIAARTSAAAFDVDTYRILTRLIKAPPPGWTIVPLAANRM